jgi:hypothetical protein
MKKIIARACLLVLLILPVLAFGHFLVFPQETRCILIDFSGFQKDGQLYFKNTIPIQTKLQLKKYIQQAETRVGNFWGKQTSDPKFIYCDNDEDFNSYGQKGVPACTHIKLGAYIVISKQGLDPDIISHELEHAEFKERIGFMKYTFKIPTWFDEGLAMQVDYRDYYSEDTLKVKSNNYTSLPAIKNLRTGAAFGSGDRSQVMLNYMTAKHEIKNWYTKEKLKNFINDINDGRKFEDAFGK